MGWVFFSNLAKEHVTCLPYGAIITRIFKYFGVELSNETEKTVNNELIDRTTLKRMKLKESTRNNPSSSTRPSKSHSLLLEEIRALNSKFDNLSSRFEIVEEKINQIYEKDVADGPRKRRNRRKCCSKNQIETCLMRGCALSQFVPWVMMMLMVDECSIWFEKQWSDYDL